MRAGELVVLPVVLAALLGGCAAPAAPVASLEGGEIEIAGTGAGSWPAGAPPARRFLRWEYETVAWRGRAAAPFHRMRTEIELAYDPDAGEVRRIRVIASEPGHAFRHLCVAPDGPVLHVRVATLLDGRREDLTVVRIHGGMIEDDACRDIGVGPRDGLVEGLEILVKEDGSFKVLPGAGAYLAGANLHVRRTMTRSPDPADRVTEDFP